MRVIKETSHKYNITMQC